jgi:transcription elongation factor GreA
MNNTKRLQLTKQGFDTLQKELAELIEEKRPKLVDRLSFARSQGDLSENSDYTNAKEELEFLDGRISELEEVLKTALVADDSSSSSKSGVAAVGKTVRVKVGAVEHTFEIVGEWEADPMQKKISPESPLGQALVGKAVGEEVEVEAPAGKVMYKIVAIE